MLSLRHNTPFIVRQFADSFLCTLSYIPMPFYHNALHLHLKTIDRFPCQSIFNFQLVKLNLKRYNDASGFYNNVFKTRDDCR